MNRQAEPSLPSRSRSTRRGMRRMLAALGGTALGLAMAATAGATPLFHAPDPDPFYSAPPDLADRQVGDVLDVRALPPLATFPGSTVNLVKFRSTDSRGGPIAATTTVITPFNHVVDGPLLSYQHIINALGAECAVSHELYSNDPNLVIREAPALNSVLLQGWSVALPDHLGPNLAYGAARLGGQITLDGIRAVKQVAGLGLGRSRAAMAGYSGGGMATAWAAALQPTYAPDLDIAGAAYGGVPMNLITMVTALGADSHPAFGLAMAAAIGMEREYPDRLPISENMNANGLAVGGRMANSCTNDIIATGAGHSAMEYAASTALIDNPDARAVLEENSLEYFDGIPTMPIFEWHSPSDPLLPVDAIDHTDRRYCDAGVRLQVDPIPIPEHMTTAVVGMPLAIDWVSARLNGVPAPRMC